MKLTFFLILKNEPIQKMIILFSKSFLQSKGDVGRARLPLILRTLAVNIYSYLSIEVGFISIFCSSISFLDT